MVNVAVLGYGTVGSGVVEVIKTNKAIVDKKAGQEINVKYVLDLREFPGDSVMDILVHDYNDILNDPEVEVIAEVMGGVEPAYTFVKAALEKGKSVCTSNKELVAKHGPELINIAREHNRNFLFEASVGGGIPVIRPLNECITADEINSITGILNGTTNYILSRIRGAKISKEKEIVIKKKKSKLNSIISKEIQTIINNKVYFKSTIKTSILLTIFFFLVSLIIDTKKISEAHNFGVYLMFFVSFIAASSCTTINSLSLEKKCILQLKTMPVSFIKVLIAKYLTNIIISLPVIIINFIISALFYDIDKVTLLMLFINPLLLTSFISLLGLILDFRFIDFTEKDSNNIIKNRIITYIPPLANLLIISILFLINPIDKYYLLLLAFSCIILFVMILMLFYLLISYKKILNANIK